METTQIDSASSTAIVPSPSATTTTTIATTTTTINTNSEPEIFLYKKRWAVLLLFSLLSFSNAVLWITFSPISSIVGEYYDKSDFLVNCLSMVYMAGYIPLVFVSSWIFDRPNGLRVGTLLGATLNVIGAWVRYGGKNEDGFTILMIGQTIASIAQTFILGVPALLASTWFGTEERSTATSLGVLANQVGIAFGMVLAPQLVSVGEDLGNYLLAQAVACSLITVGIFLLFSSNPEKPPSRAAANAMAALQHRKASSASFSFHSQENKMFGTSQSSIHKLIVHDAEDDHHRHQQSHPSTVTSISSASSASSTSPSSDANVTSNDYIQGIAICMKDRDFLLLFFGYGINVGVFYAVTTLLNQILTPRFPGEEVQFGWIGFVIVVCGLFGSVLGGMYLDRTGRFKFTTIVSYCATVLGMIFFTLTADYTGFVPIYIASGVLGFFMTAIIPVGFEYGAELSYPVAESTSSGLLNCSAQIFGIALIIGIGEIQDSISATAGNWLLCGTLGVGLIATICVRENLKRRQMDKSSSINDTKDEKVLNSVECRV